MFGFGLNSRKWVKTSQKTEKETKKNAKLTYDTWKNIIKDYKKAFEKFNTKHASEIVNLKHSMVYFEMVSFEKRLNLIQNLAVWGYYHSSLQELRFLLDTTVLAYYLDQQLPKTDYSEKIKLMQKHKGELWGERLRRRTYMKEREFGEKVENVISDINNSIDQYLADNRVDIWNQKNLPFNDVEFNDCVRLSKKTVAIILKHYNERFPDFDNISEKIVLPIENIQEESIEKDQEETTENNQEDLSE